MHFARASLVSAAVLATLACGGSSSSDDSFDPDIDDAGGFAGFAGGAVAAGAAGKSSGGSAGHVGGGAAAGHGGAVTGGSAGAAKGGAANGGAAGLGGFGGDDAGAGGDDVGGSGGAPVYVTCGADDTTVPIATASPPAYAPSCANGAIDGTETDVDCGGSCAPCTTHHACVVAADCGTSHCDAATKKCLPVGPAFAGYVAAGTGDNEDQTTDGGALGDVDGDGFLDLVEVDTDEMGAALRLGHGDGTFAAPMAIDSGYLGVPQIVDVDADGHADLVGTDGGFVVLRGLGGGAFGPAEHYPAFIEATIAVVHAGDVDGDGDVDFVGLGDLAADDNTPGAWVMLAHGDGTFATPTVVPLGIEGGFALALALADLNGDGAADLIVAPEGECTETVGFPSNRSYFYLADGKGGFGPGVGHDLGGAAGDFRFGDLTGDGKIDIVVAADVGIIVLEGDGAGAFKGHPAVRAISGGASVALGDFDGDGALDVASTIEDATLGAPVVAVLFGDGKGGLSDPLPLGLTNLGALVVGDVNGDHVDDIGALGQPYYRMIYGDRARALDAPTVASVTAPLQLDSFIGERDLAITDLDGDGKLDVAVVGGNDDGHVHVLLGDGTGHLGAGVAYPLPDGPGDIVAGDFNGDLRPDLVVANVGAPTFTVFLNDGTGKLTAATTPVPMDASLFVLTGDFNGDGKLDLFTIGGNAAVALGHGDGTFGVAIESPVGDQALSDAALADFNGDGHLDAVVLDGSPNVGVLLGDGTGKLGARVQYPMTDGGLTVKAGDVDGDGKLDLVVTSASSFGGVDVLLGDGKGAFGPSKAVTSNLAESLAVVDVDGDGALDLVTAGDEGPIVHVFHGDGHGAFTDAGRFDCERNDAFEVGDFNGDGRPDIAAVTEFGTAQITLQR